MPDDLAKTPGNIVVCTFYDKAKAVIVEVPIAVNTTLGARVIALREACQTHARSKGHKHFAMPADAGTSPGKWLVFEMSTSTFASFVKVWPNQAAAEMWMQHHG